MQAVRNKFYSVDGPLALDYSVGRGGEGEVFALADGTARALKIYEDPDPAREAKVRSMVCAKLTLSCPHVAFPVEVAFGPGRKFAGFTMNLVQGCQPIHELYAPASRRRTFPGADWRFLVRTAANVARVFSRIHAAGAIIGDVNGSGILVSKRAVVAVIDADSFQWDDHYCRVGVQEFTPPELQGQRLDGIKRTMDHDSFGLAVVIFQLLFLGRHPHAGVPTGRDMALPEAIAESMFAYSRIRRVRLAPPPGALLLSDLPLGVRTLFERAFFLSRGRPSPEEWFEELDRLEKSLTKCDRDSRHYHSAASPCPWCRVERLTNAPVFGAGSLAERTEPIARARLEIPAVERVLDRARNEAGEAATPAGLEHRLQHEMMNVPVFAEDGRPRSPDECLRSYQRARDGMDSVLDSWRGRIGAWAANKAAALLADDFLLLQRATQQGSITLAQVEAGLREQQIENELKRVLLSDAAIAGVGRRRLATLAAVGIVSAADIHRTALERIPAIGEQVTINLIIWRDGMRADFDRRIVVDPVALEQASTTIREKAREGAAAIKQTLIRKAGKLDRALDDVVKLTQVRDPLIEAAVKSVNRAKAELRHLGLEVPRGWSTKPDTVVAKSNSIGKKAKGPLCPLCGRGMVKRWARAGSSPNRYFFGCAAYPRCSGSRPIRR